MDKTVVIIGGGPAGTASAMNLLRYGFKPIIVENEKFPRYHIGESLTTECVDALNRLDLDEDIRQLRAPRKNGVRIFSQHPENSFYVGAGDAWQVERAGFDAMMLEVAISRGTELITGKVSKLTQMDGGWQTVVKLKDDSCNTLSSRFVIDASGQSRVTQRMGFWGELESGDYARQIAFFSQFTHVNNMPEDKKDTLIFHRERHEWCWMIPLSDTVTSVGLVVPVDLFKQEKSDLESFYHNKLRSFSDPLSMRLGKAAHSGTVRTVSNYSYQIHQYARNGLYCVGDSHRFIDPIFSFGVEFAVVEAEYVATAIHSASESDESLWPEFEQQYIKHTSAAQNVIGDMLAYFWQHPWGFANMAHVRHKDEFLELFAGRIYQLEPGPGLQKMRETIRCH